MRRLVLTKPSALTTSLAGGDAFRPQSSPATGRLQAGSLQGPPGALQARGPQDELDHSQKGSGKLEQPRKLVETLPRASVSCCGSHGPYIWGVT